MLSLNSLDFLRFLAVWEGLEKSGRPVFEEHFGARSCVGAFRGQFLLHVCVYMYLYMHKFLEVWEVSYGQLPEAYGFWNIFSKMMEPGTRESRTSAGRRRP